MTNRIVLVGAGLLLIAGLASFGLTYRNSNVPGERAAAERPPLALLTSLPLVFGESFSLEGGGSPTLSRLEQRYRVVPIGVADAASLEGQRLLLMAHPRAQPAAALVEFDQWVRRGGHVLLLADPKLDWPSELPLGDVLRPPPMFADTGLLRHWGLILTSSGLTDRGGCKIADDGLIARCRIGRGQATVIADADFLNVGNSADESLDLLVDELDRLESNLPSASR